MQWLSVSTLDGHAANGLFVFGVGTSPPKVSPFGTVEGTSGGLLAVSALGRWLLYLGLALLIGGAGTCLFVLKGSLPSGWRVLLRTAWLLAALGAATMTLAEQHIVGAPTLLPLFQTEVGHSFLVLTLVVVVGCGLAVVLVDLLPGRPTLWGLGATVALVMFIHAQAGHAYAPSGLKPLHFLEQLAHMLAVGIWVGGLVWLLLALRPDNEFDRVAAIRRFSRLAGYALGVVLLTGFLRAFNEIGSVRELLSTSYGRALLVKVALVVVIVGLGGLNRYRLVPALEAGAKAIQGLRRAVRGEVVVAMGILAATAVLAGLAPAVLSALGSAGPPAGTSVSVTGTDYAQTTRVRLTVSPGAVGRNSFTAKVSESTTGRPVAASSVQLEFSLSTRPEIGSATLSLRRSSSGVWQASGSELAIAGTWSVTVLVQTPTTGVSVPLSVRVGPGTSQ